MLHSEFRMKSKRKLYFGLGPRSKSKYFLGSKNEPMMNVFEMIHCVAGSSRNGDTSCFVVTTSLEYLCKSPFSLPCGCLMMRTNAQTTKRHFSNEDIMMTTLKSRVKGTLPNVFKASRCRNSESVARNQAKVNDLPGHTCPESR